MPVEKNNKVTIEYTGRFDNKDGEIFDTSEGKQPLTFISGVGMVVPGFDNAIQGMEKGEEKEVTLTPDQAYGEHKEEMKQKIPRKALPPEQVPEKGMMLGMTTPQGQQIPAKIIDVDDENITIDVNHPLAGKTLHFSIKLLDYEKVDMEKLMKEAQEQQKAQQAQNPHSCKDHDCKCSEDDPCKNNEEDCKCETDNQEKDSNPTESVSKKKDEPSIEDLAA